jgi:PIN domain nuclease of toxin-antitoxin system
MNLLLDTHIWIWNDLQAEKISSQVAQELASSSNEQQTQLPNADGR